MEKVSTLNKLKDRNNKAIGLTIILSSLSMIFSLTLLAYMANPLFLIQIPLFLVLGYSGTFVFWIFAIIFGCWYYNVLTNKWFNQKRVIMLLTFILSIMLIFNLIIIAINMNQSIGEINSLSDYYKVSFIEPLMNYFQPYNGTGMWTVHRVSSHDVYTLGLILPFFAWILGGWWYGVTTIIILVLVALYALYVMIMNEYTVVFSSLAFWTNDKNAIKISKTADSLDLNQPTEEFELNFEQDKTHREKLELIEKVRKNMDTKDYKELSNKIASEKEKMIELRNKIVSKLKQKKENHASTSTISESHRNEIMASLGYSSYSALKATNERKQQLVQQTEPFRYTKAEEYTPEENVEENKVLIQEGYKTTEQVYNVEEPTLADQFVQDFIDDLEAYDPTQETPLLNNYKEIFESEEFENEMKETLETNIQVEEDVLEEKQVSTITEEIEEAEVIIEDISEEVTVEEYLSIPKAIEETSESVIAFNQAETIEEQVQDQTNNEEYSSLSSETSEEELITEEQVMELEREEESEPAYDFLPEEDDEEEEEENKERPLDWCQPYVLPSTSILSTQSSSFDNSTLVQEATDKSKQLNILFESFGVKAQVNSFEIGPTVSTFKITLEPGIKTTKVTNLEDNIKLTLGAEYIRIIAPIPGTSFIGIEVPNSTKRPVLFKTVYDETPDNQDGIQISIGQDVSGKSLSFDLTKAPHLLVAGSTGSGKSVAINTILASILLRYKPTDVQLVLVDPKMVEFAPFHGVPHLMAEVITDAANANNALKAMVDEMENRYRMMAENGVKKLEELNDKLISEGKLKLPYVVVVIDELADLMMVAAKEVEDSIMRITQKARAAGIHMILATQRPSTEIITGTIKSNIPSRMAFTVASSIDSRTILGQVGAEKLIGMGDMLVSLYGQLPFRGQGAYISNEEVEDISAFVKSQCDAFYQIDVQSLTATLGATDGALVSTNDPMYIAAKDTVIHHQKASTSMLQRHLGIGYNKAANIIETLEAEGIVGPAKGSKPREVLTLI